MSCIVPRDHLTNVQTMMVKLCILIYTFCLFLLIKISIFKHDINGLKTITIIKMKKP